jgi:hypothetical protein
MRENRSESYTLALKEEREGYVRRLAAAEDTELKKMLQTRIALVDEQIGGPGGHAAAETRPRKPTVKETRG